MTEGTAAVAGFDVRHQPKQVRSNIGLAGQFAAVDDNVTGFENLRMVGLLNHIRKPLAISRLRELLEQFGLVAVLAPLAVNSYRKAAYRP